MCGYGNTSIQGLGYSNGFWNATSSGSVYVYSPYSANMSTATSTSIIFLQGNGAAGGTNCTYNGVISNVSTSSFKMTWNNAVTDSLVYTYKIYYNEPSTSSGSGTSTSTETEQYKNTIIIYGIMLLTFIAGFKIFK